MIIKITKGQTEGFALVLGNSETREKTLKQRKERSIQRSRKLRYKILWKIVYNK